MGLEERGEEGRQGTSPPFHSTHKLETNGSAQIYHATCHAEAVISTNTLAARLKNEERESRSRSGTPEVTISISTRSTPPRTLQPRASLSPSPARTGVKRKAEGDEPSLGDTPPMKKLEISA